MAGSRRLPVFTNRSAAECQGQKITEQISKDEEHDHPGRISELLIRVKDAEVEKKDGELV